MQQERRVLRQGLMGWLAYLLGLAWVLENGGDWGGWDGALHIARHVGSLTALPIIVTAADIKKVISKSVFNTQPDALKQYLVFGHKLGLPLLPINAQSVGRLGDENLLVAGSRDFWSLYDTNVFYSTHDERDPVCRVGTEIFRCFRDVVVIKLATKAPVNLPYLGQNANAPLRGMVSSSVSRLDPAAWSCINHLAIEGTSCRLSTSPGALLASIPSSAFVSWPSPHLSTGPQDPNTSSSMGTGSRTHSLYTQ